ncbi:hypothetical protein ACWGKW_41025 [Streptomyces sp. NPDC054766]
MGGAAGSRLGSVVCHAGGWTAFPLLGAALPLLALPYWATERGGRKAPGRITP